MADSEKAAEVPMETSTVESAEADTGESSKAAAAAPADGTDKEQVKTEKPQAKPAGKAASTKKDPSGFSNVSASYSQLQSGLQDIVKSYVASKSSTTNKGASTSNAKAEEAKKQPDETNGKRRKANDDSDTYGGEEERNFFDEFLDRTKSDFYCKVCDSHMNSEQMWENHVQGKRHLKNIKKDPGEPPSKVKAVKTDLIPKILRTLDQVREPVVGLSYMCELQRAESYLDPTYSCFLCHATCTVSSVVDHILGTKHRLAYLKAANPDEYSLVEEMKLKKSGLTSIAEDYAREFERKTGRGNMEVKIEKPKMAPPSSKRDRRYIEDESDDDDFSFRRRHISPPPVELGWRRDRDRWSPPQVTTMMSPQQMTLRLSSMLASTANYSTMPMMEKLNVLQQVSHNLVVVSESEGREVMKIINALTQSLLQYKIRVLPPQLQDTLARHIISGDTKALESTLGMAGSGMSNVGSVISSMAASGDLPLRNAHSVIAPALRMLPGSLGGPSNSSENGRNMWGPSGPGVARMPSPMRGGYNSGSYPPSSQWPGGMGGSSFRGSDRSSFGY